MAPLVFHYNATDISHQNHRSASSTSAHENVQKIRSAVEIMVRKMTLSFDFILEKDYFGLGSASQSVLFSEGSPLFRSIIFSSVINLIWRGITLHIYLSG